MNRLKKGLFLMISAILCLSLLASCMIIEELFTSSTTPQTSPVTSESSSAPSESASPEGEAAPLDITAPEWETQSASYAAFSFALPKSWELLESMSSEEVVVYIPQGADVQTGTSNITLAKAQSVASLSLLEVQMVPLIKSTIAQYEEASEVTTGRVNAPIGEVLTLSYDFGSGGKNLSQLQYYVMVEQDLLVITITTAEETISPTSLDVGRYLLATLKHS